MRLAMDQFDYELPAHAIAQVPLEPRDAARLLVDQGPSEAPTHRSVADLPSLLRPGDVLVVNETRVMAARLALVKSTGGAVEVLLLEPLSDDETATADVRAGSWAALVRPSRRVRDGAELTSTRDPSLRAVMGPRLDEQRRAVQIWVGGVQVVDASGAQLLDQAGEPPLPPYIDAETARRGVAGCVAAGSGDERRNLGQQESTLSARYQTVYARTGASAAAPTAGLHLTQDVLAAIRARGIAVFTVDLTVGLGTFMPITAGYAHDHTMHTEHFCVPVDTLVGCEHAERVVAVGTTTVRALESAARIRAGAPQPQPRAAATLRQSGAVTGRTDLFLQRGERFLVTDALLTNFHLPRSSLLLLIDAFIGPRWRDLYMTALAEGYRFLSFGDAMLLERCEM